MGSENFQETFYSTFQGAAGGTVWEFSLSPCMGQDRYISIKDMLLPSRFTKPSVTSLER